MIIKIFFYFFCNMFDWVLIFFIFNVCNFLKIMIVGYIEFYYSNKNIFLKINLLNVMSKKINVK